MAAEDEEEREDVPALATAEKAVPAAPRGDEEAEYGGTEDRSGGRTAKERGAVVSSGLRSERSKGGEVPRGRAAFAQSESLGRVANRRSVTTGEIAPETPARAAGELWKDGPVWTVCGALPEMDGALRAAAAERPARAEEALLPSRDENLAWTGLEWAARGGTAGTALAGAGRSGLEGLYRQTVGGLRPAAPALPPEQAGRTVRAQEPGSAASLAVDELDRAVRRDSRRYDGGMSIY